MDINFISYIPAIVGILAIGLFVLLNARNAKNRAFALFSLFIALWLACLYFADISHSSHISLWILRFALFFASIAILMFDYFTLIFPYPTIIPKFKQFYYALPLLIVALLSLTPIVLPAVTVQGFIAEPENTSFIYTLSDIVSVLYLIIGVGFLVRKLTRSDYQQKQQIKFVLIGITIAVVTNVFTGDILTLFKVDKSYIDFGGFSLLLFSFFVAYAMFKHGFLDIRLLVARTVAYILTLGCIAVAYSAIIIIVLSRFDKSTHISEGQNLLYISLAVFLALTFQPIKRFFDRLSNRLFYRDAYDPQIFLDQFNRTLVLSYELNKLLQSSSTVIEENLKSSFCLFIIKKTPMRPGRIVGATNQQIFTDTDVTFLTTMHRLRQKVIVTDELGESQLNLKRALQNNKIAVFAELFASTSDQDIGYIALGSKKSGNPYSSQDLRIIEIIANELVIAIQNALRFEEIQNFNLTLQGKVDDATRKLRHANERLKALDETKDDFISMASHQLRTPLTSIKGYISMVLEGDAGRITKMEREMLSQAFFSSQRMVYLIADLLNVSRLKTGKFIIESCEVNLATLVQQELEQLEETADSRQLSLSFDQPKNFPDVMLDETKIRQVIMNFVDNAIYYTPAGGHIGVQLINNPNTIELRVKDDGIGVAKSEQPHLFTKFYRASNARAARPDGTGLGLFMAKKVIIAEGGSLIFESEQGRGSTFGFIFSKSRIAVGHTKKPANT
jgi:signal transduction histidine kinase